MNVNHNKLIYEIAELLSGTVINSQAIVGAFSALCKEFQFESAFVYEVDHDKRFNLSESVNFPQATIKQFLAEKIPYEYKQKLLTTKVFYAQKDMKNAEMEQFLFEFFGGAELAISAIRNIYGGVDGLIVLKSNAVAYTLSSDDLNSIGIVMALLNRYIGTRTNQNKTVFAKTALSEILDNTGIDIYVNDFNNHDILYVNESMASPYGGVDKFMGHKCWEILYPGQNGPCEFCPQKKLIDENGAPSKVYTWDYQRPFDGSWFRVFSAAFRWVDGRLAHVVSSADITENKRNEALVQYMANFDSLTNLPNRRKLISDCEAIINSETDSGVKTSLLFFDIDGFKAINDEYGHDAGDEFLVMLTKFLGEIPMLAGKIYRHGGDEFVAVLNATSQDSIRNLFNFIQLRFKKPWQLRNNKVYCNVSVGVSIYPQNGTTATELISNADHSMYRAKKKGGSICFTDEWK